MTVIRTKPAIYSTKSSSSNRTFWSNVIVKVQRVHNCHAEKVSWSHRIAVNSGSNCQHRKMIRTQISEKNDRTAYSPKVSTTKTPKQLLAERNIVNQRWPHHRRPHNDCDGPVNKSAYKYMVHQNLCDTMKTKKMSVAAQPSNHRQ